MTPRDRQCRGKQRYLSLNEARLRAKSLHKLKKARYNAYACSGARSQIRHSGTSARSGR